MSVSLAHILKLYDESSPVSDDIRRVSLRISDGKPLLEIDKVTKADLGSDYGVMGLRSNASDPTTSVWWFHTPIKSRSYKTCKIDGVLVVMEVHPQPEEVMYSYRDWMIAFGHFISSSEGWESSDSEWETSVEGTSSSIEEEYEEEC